MRACSFCLLWLACAALAWGQTPPEPATGFAPKPIVTTQHFMVVAAHPLAVDAGYEVLKRGGSAMDAAITAQMVLNVVEPQSSGVGGGGFLLYYDAKAKRLAAYDGRETAPADASPKLFLDTDGKPLRFVDAMVGGRAVGVPGLTRMLELAHRRHGRIAWSQLIAPAVELAETGFLVSPRLHALLAQERFLPNDPNARRVFYDVEGRALGIGVRLGNPELAATLRAIASGGARVLHEGPIARAIAQAVTAAQRPGSLSESDLAGYRAIEREPICGSYHAYRICGVPPPSAGGITVLEILKLLESRPMYKLAPGSLMSAHLFAEAGRLAYADRNRYIADPAFVDIPMRELLDPRYLSKRGRLIDVHRSMKNALPGALPRTAERPLDATSIEAPSTTHISIVDRDGNAVALTSSIEAAFGSRIMVRGFLLNNELTDFSFLPESEGRKVANAVEGGKRPRSSMSPTMVFDEHGRLSMVLGSPGGNWIINFVARTLVATLAQGMNVQDAVGLPHVGSRNGPTEIERAPGADRLRLGLELLGHEVRVLDLTSGLHAIQRVPGGWMAGIDPRREGAARGE